MRLLRGELDKLGGSGQGRLEDTGALKPPWGEEEPQRRPGRKVGRKPRKCMSPKPRQGSQTICFDDTARRHTESGLWGRRDLGSNSM